VEQVATKHSILVKGSNFFWKFIPSISESFEYQTFYEKQVNNPFVHILFPVTYTWLEDAKFYKFAELDPPLSKSEAKLCLCDLLKETAKALSELHGRGFAHIDVRLPNICFTTTGTRVKLIDLDRVVKVGANPDRMYHGEMYVLSNGWNAANCDWKQLGLLAAQIILNSDNHSEIMKDRRVDDNPCLFSLIKEGKYISYPLVSAIPCF